MNPFGKVHWFPLIELGCVVASGTIWIVLPQTGWWPLILAVSPWVVRAIAGNFPIRRTIFDIPIAIFLLTAALGVWTAYDRELAWQKFWIILAAVLSYYALARQPADHLWLIAGLLGLLGSVLSVMFLLKQDWQTQPADLEIINQLGLKWMSLRPSILGQPLPPNISGGTVAMLLPFPFALAIYAWRNRSLVVTVLAILMVALTGAGLVATSSRGAWIALAVAGFFWILWGLSIPAARIYKMRRWVVYLFYILVAAIVFIGVSLVFPGGLLGIANRLPGLPSGVSRLELARNTVNLIGDYPYTGVGLTAFPGQYSHYVMLIPNFLFSYSHNFYLDVALEQGVIGLIALLVVLLGSFGVLLTHDGTPTGETRFGLVRGALIASLTVIALHGLVDDAMYGNRGTPLLLLFAGMAVLVSRSMEYQTTEADHTASLANSGSNSRSGWRPKLVAGVIIVVLFGTLVANMNRTLRAIWYANLGAIDMARADLIGFPSDRWESGDTSQDLVSAKALFEKSLFLDPQNRTAHFRLGLIFYQQRDFQSAVNHLEVAYQADEDHRGIRKALGFCLVWLSDFERAGNLLVTIPEAKQELEAYAWWWETEERRDLASQASEMINRLNSTKQ